MVTFTEILHLGEHKKMEIFGVKDCKQANCFAPSTETAEKGAFGAF